MTDTRPVWLLDVDGVLNARRPGWSAAPSAGNAYALGQAWRIRWEQRVADEIRRLHEAGVVEVRWSTTWVDHIDQIEGLLGLPSFPTAFTMWGKRPGNRKILAALDVVRSERRRLVWTDDDAIPADGHPDRLELDAAGALLIAPDPRRGLRREHLEQIEAFCR